MMEQSDEQALRDICTSLALLGAEIEDKTAVLQNLEDIGFNLDYPVAVAAKNHCADLHLRFAALKRHEATLRVRLGLALTPDI